MPYSISKHVSMFLHIGSEYEHQINMQLHKTLSCSGEKLSIHNFY